MICHFLPQYIGPVQISQTVAILSCLVQKLYRGTGKFTIYPPANLPTCRCIARLIELMLEPQ